MAKITKYFFFLIFLFVFIQANSQDFLSSIKKCKRELMNTGHGDLKLMDSCYIGKKIPDLKLKTIDGEIINLGDLRGKVIILNLWSTSCGPCIAEIPGLNDLVKLFNKEDIIFISLLHESKESYTKFLAKGHSFAFKVVPKSKKIYYNQLNFIGFPRTIVIDKKGTIRRVFSGGENSKKAPELIKKKLIPVINLLLKGNFSGGSVF